MSEPASGSMLNIRGLILFPAVITMAITLLRLAGELAHWSPRFFSAAAGGGMAIIGISWLPILFGPYFAVKLTGSGQGTPSLWKAFGFALLGWVIAVGGGFLGFAPQIKFPGKEAVGLLLMAVGAFAVMLGWPALFRVLVAYGYAARIPVAVVMLFAMLGHWGTHYDALPPNYSGPTSFIGMYVYLALLPQMIIWIAFTVLVGGLVGILVAALVPRGQATSPAA